MFCHLRVIHINSECSFLRLIFFGDSSIYSCPLPANNIFCTPQQHSFWLFRFYMDCSDSNFHFSCNLIKPGIFGNMLIPEILDWALTQYMSLHQVMDLGDEITLCYWVSYVRLAPLDDRTLFFLVLVLLLQAVAYPSLFHWLVPPTCILYLFWGAYTKQFGWLPTVIGVVMAVIIYINSTCLWPFPVVFIIIKLAIFS